MSVDLLNRVPVVNSSTYVALHKQLGVAEGLMTEDHPLFPVSHLDVIDSSVLENPVFKDYNQLNYPKLCEMLEKYNRIPGRPKINLPWQVISLMAKGGIKPKGREFFDENDNNRLILDLLNLNYVALDKDKKTDKFGQNPIHLLGLAGNTSVFDAVCKTKGTDKNALNNNGCSVIGYAAMGCEGEDREMLNHLTETHHLSQEDFVDFQGNKLLHYLGMSGAVKSLIHFCIVEQRRIKEETGKIEAELSSIEDESTRNKEIQKRVAKIRDIYDVDEQNKEGYAPLHWLLLNGHTAAFKIAFEKFPSLGEYDLTGGLGMNFAHCAAVSGKRDALEFVFEKYPHLQQTNDKNGATIGLHGIRSGSADFIRYLEAQGYSLKAVDDRGHGAIEYAVAYNKQHLLPMIRKKGIASRLPPLRVAA